MKRLSILGSTGSIGRNALKIASMYPDRFNVTVLAAANNVNLLAEQIEIFRPQIAVVLNSERADLLKTLLSSHEIKKSNHRRGSPLNEVEICWGDRGYALAASHENVDTVLLAMVGAAGLMPALAAIDAGKNIALANKETLVMAGDLVMSRAAANGVVIHPVDSEHSAIFQCLEGNRPKDLKKIFLTASGGPFRTTPLESFKNIKPKDALNHPTWNMGSKITIDSATLMNKALEIVEAVQLFNVPVSDIEVLVHPQSIVHSMVGFSDGSVMAQMGLPDMKGAISYALSWPERLDLKLDFPDFAALGHLFFEQPDKERFPSLNFAVKACKEGGTLPAVMNAANEIAVNAFLDHKIGFSEIFTTIEETMNMHENIVNCSGDNRKTRDIRDKKIPGRSITCNYTLEDIIRADTWARQRATSFIQSIH